MAINGSQRYRNVLTKARILSDRQHRAAMEGREPVYECTGDRERDCIIAEFDRIAQGGAR